MNPYIAITVFVALVKTAVGDEMQDFCDTKSEPFNVLVCCPIPLEVFEANNWNRCLQEAGVPVPDSGSIMDIDPMQLAGKCIGDCIFDAEGLLMGKNVHSEKLKELIIMKTKDNKVWSELAQSVVENSTMAIENISETNSDPFKCATKADLFIHIYTALLLMGCPESEWSTGQMHRFEEATRQLSYFDRAITCGVYLSRHSDAIWKPRLTAMEHMS